MHHNQKQLIQECKTSSALKHQCNPSYQQTIKEKLYYHINQMMEKKSLDKFNIFFLKKADTIINVYNNVISKNCILNPINCSYILFVLKMFLYHIQVYMTQYIVYKGLKNICTYIFSYILKQTVLLACAAITNNPKVLSSGKKKIQHLYHKTVGKLEKGEIPYLRKGIIKKPLVIIICNGERKTKCFALKVQNRTNISSLTQSYSIMNWKLQPGQK